MKDADTPSRAASHRTYCEHIGWLRAAVLGANDGILSTASLVLGVAAAHGTRSAVLIAGVAGLVAGAMSMAAGEYVSVHSQADSEEADLARERAELRADHKGEHQELTAIYVGRGLDPSLAEQVANQLTAHDAIGAHARDELGMFGMLRARPIQAAFTSAASFAVGAAMPLIVTALVPAASLIVFVAGTSLLFLALLGAVAARVGGASVVPSTIRVTFWGRWRWERRRASGSCSEQWCKPIECRPRCTAPKSPLRSTAPMVPPRNSYRMLVSGFRYVPRSLSQKKSITAKLLFACK
jgi:vacuolar iron transporter family protein